MTRCGRLLLVCVCLVALAGIGCRPDSDRAETHDSTITVLYESDDYVLGPARDDSPKFLMFLPLVRGYGLKPRLGLAQSWEHFLDYTAWTFHLRRDMPVTFLWPYVESITAHRRIRGLGTPDRVNQFAYIEELWLEEEQK